MGSRVEAERCLVGYCRDYNGLDQDGSGKGSENDSDLGDVFKFGMIRHAKKIVMRCERKKELKNDTQFVAQETEWRVMLFVVEDKTREVGLRQA